MEKIKLPEVTLIGLTDYRVDEHLKAIEESSKGIEWGGVKLVYDEGIKHDVNNWNYKVIYELPKYVSTPFAFLFHADGYVIHPELWRPEWLAYDYIGAPWPLPTDDYSYRDESGDLVRVGNSVSLRSKKLMDLIATRPWRSYYGNTHEDGFISCHHRKWLESEGCKFAPLEEAVLFAKEHEIPENVGIDTFAFHKVG